MRHVAGIERFCLGTHTAESQPLEAADDSRARRERQRVADDGPQQRDQAQRDEAHLHGVDDLALTHQASVEERQSRGHDQHQRGADEDPGRVSVVHWISPL